MNLTFSPKNFKMIVNLSKVKILLFKEVSNIPTPASISYMWNFGSILGVILVMQILSGFFLASQYKAGISEAFSSVVSICFDVNNGWVLRSVHANGASAFFICVYIHIGRGLYYGSFSFFKTWSVGVVILLLLMGTSFLGYVLPWGQMSFWGATVITSLLSAFPLFGEALVQWVWGGFSVSEPTLVRFFVLHYILPFVILVMVLIHLIFLHSSGSSNPLGISLNSDKIFFFPYFLSKDILGFVVFFFLFFVVVFLVPDIFMDPDNFSPANPLVTPPHIQPEWYFLFAYTILRSIPSKLGGVVGLLMSILSLLLLPLFSSFKSVGSMFSFSKKVFFWFFVATFFILTWLGAKAAEPPFVDLGQTVSVVYFFLLPFLSF
nr:cytochrome b [Oxylipeurus chiniri]